MTGPVNWSTLTDSGRGRSAIGFLALSALVALAAAVRAVRLDPVPDAPPLTFATADALSAHGDAAPVDIRAAVERDPFAPERSAPAQRYRIPGEAEDVRVAAIEPPKPVVLGIAVASDAARSFATCALDGGSPTIVHIGNTIGPYTVKSIEHGRVTFTTADGKRLEVSALKPGS